MSRGLCIKEKTEEPIRKCNCKKTRCLKLYCECFLANRYCDNECKCVDCGNVPEKEEEREQAKQVITDKNPLAFQSFVTKLVVNKQQRGCTCKKSQCSKKYCECFHNGVGCVKSCKCYQCSNIYNNQSEESQNNQQQQVRSSNLPLLELQRDQTQSLNQSNNINIRFNKNQSIMKKNIIIVNNIHSHQQQLTNNNM